MAASHEAKEVCFELTRDRASTLGTPSRFIRKQPRLFEILADREGTSVAFVCP